MITTERALSLAAAALGDSLRVLVQTGNRDLASEVHEARDKVLQLRDGGKAAMGDGRSAMGKTEPEGNAS